MSDTSSRQLRILGFWVALISIISAVGVHVYLTIIHFNLKTGQEGSAICEIGSGFSCDAAVASAYSEFLGVPISIWGAVTNFSLLLMLIAYRWMLIGEHWQGRLRFFSGATATAIALASIIMGVISMTKVGSWCLFCVIAYALSFIALVGVGLVVRKSEGQPKLEKLPIKEAIGLGVGLVAIAFFTNKVVSTNTGADKSERIVKAAFYEWQGNRRHNVSMESPIKKGKVEGQPIMTIIEFADFRCGHCKFAAPALKAFIQAHPDAQLQFWTFPLDGQCNAKIGQSYGPSCQLAYAAFCAQRQDKAWEAHDWIFDRQTEFGSVDGTQRLLGEMAEDLAINKDEFMSCLEDETIHDLVRKQAEIGDQMGVAGTPTIYVNGAKLPMGQLLPVLKSAYDYAKHGKRP